jgi:hypothetical protein
MAKPAAAQCDAAVIAKATSPVPADIGRNAAVMGASADGKMKELRAGPNGRMACSISPATRCASTRSGRPGATLGIKKEPPKPTTVGVAYMLKGDKAASNTDRYATKPTADNEWVVSGPHIMILPTDVSQLDAYPTIGRPWVMWKGTPYAHIMVATTSMAKSVSKAPAEEKAADQK